MIVVPSCSHEMGLPCEQRGPRFVITNVERSKTTTAEGFARDTCTTLSRFGVPDRRGVTLNTTCGVSTQHWRSPVAHPKSPTGLREKYYTVLYTGWSKIHPPEKVRSSDSPSTLSKKSEAVTFRPILFNRTNRADSVVVALQQGVLYYTCNISLLFTGYPRGPHL